MKTNFKHEDRSLQRPKKKNRTVAKARAAKRRKAEQEKARVYALVDERDRGRCRVCGLAAAHHHHIRYRSQGGKHVPENIVSVCVFCHERIHAKRLIVSMNPANGVVWWAWS